MINILLTLAQLFFEKDNKSSSEQIRDAAIKYTEAGKRMAQALTLWLLAALLFFSGFVIFIIEFGLQFDKGVALSFTGLILSSLILLTSSFLTILISVFVLKESDSSAETGYNSNTNSNNNSYSNKNSNTNSKRKVFSAKSDGGFNYGTKDDIKEEILTVVYDIALMYLREFKENHEKSRSKE